MKPESVRFIDQANIFISRADVMLTVSLKEDAARCAYLASFHIAQAYIFERTGKISKSHTGVQTEFYRLTKDDARVDPILRRFLSQSYEFKSAADYFTGSEAITSIKEASEALETSKVFVAHFTRLVTVPGVIREDR